MKGTVDHTTRGEGCAAKKTKNKTQKTGSSLSGFCGILTSQFNRLRLASVFEQKF